MKKVLVFVIFLVFLISTKKSFSQTLSNLKTVEKLETVKIFTIKNSGNKYYFHAGESKDKEIYLFIYCLTDRDNNGITKLPESSKDFRMIKQVKKGRVFFEYSFLNEQGKEDSKIIDFSSIFK